MQTNILVDLNVIMDVFLERPGYKASVEIFELGTLQAYNLYVSAHIVSTFAYLLENAKVPRRQILVHVDWLLQVFRIVPTDAVLIAKTLKSNITDFEDALIEKAAELSGCTVIVTRNLKDFRQSTVPALNPETFLESI